MLISTGNRIRGREESEAKKLNFRETNEEQRWIDLLIHITEDFISKDETLYSYSYN